MRGEPATDAEESDIGQSTQALTVPQADATPPNTAELLIIEPPPGTDSAIVWPGGSDDQLTIKNKGSVLEVRLRGGDWDSGMRALELWCTRTLTTCSQATGLCSQSGPGLQSAPTLSAARPPVAAGAQADETMNATVSLDLKSFIPQAQVAQGQTRTVELDCWLKAVNNFGLSTSTHTIEIGWRESYVPPPPPPKSCYDTCYTSCVSQCPPGRERPGCVRECRFECELDCNSGNL